MNKVEITPIAYICNDYTSKFGIPRQAGLVEELESKIVFEKEYRVPEALRGIEEYSNLWLIWQFSENIKESWSPTVRPPRLGGNIRVGVFATRSPFRPNGLGLSCVKLLRVEHSEKMGDVLVVSGADLMNGTPIFDIKPYLPYSDCVPDAQEGFAAVPKAEFEVEYANGVKDKIPENKRAALEKILSYDPRPHYQNDISRIYGFKFAGMEIKFKMSDGICLITDAEKIS